MGNGTGVGAAMEGIHVSMAGLDALFAEDDWLETDAPTRTSAGARASAGAGAVVDVLERRYEIRLERMAVLKRLEAQLAAVKARDAAEALDIQHAMAPPEARLHERTYAEMSAIEEIAAVLTISSPAAAALLTQARHLTSLPLAMDALAAGTISWQHARIIADESEGLGPAGATALTGHFFDPNAPHPARGAAPGELSPSRFRAKVRAWRERHHPQTLEKRHAKSAADRRMEYTPDRDGMAWLSLYLPADTANAIWNRTTALARGLQHPREPRTITQLRPDIAASLLLGAATALRPDQDTSRGQNTTGEGNRDDVLALGQVPAPKADVLVTVPVFALLGLTDEPAHLDGYGPIPTSMARKLLTHGAGSFYRVLVDPRDGAPLEIGRTNYRVTKVMKKALQLRDGKCTFPGCNNRSLDNDTDHLQAWQHGGTTGISNLAQLCPKHHRLKHNSGWTPTPATKTQPPGWTSPTGRHYKPEQPDREPPHWPPGLPPGATETPGHLPGPTETPGRFDAEPSWIFAEDPPPEEPIDDNLENPADFPPDDPVWDDFYAAPPKLAKDPFPDWHLWLSESGR